MKPQERKFVESDPGDRLIRGGNADSIATLQLNLAFKTPAIGCLYKPFSRPKIERAEKKNSKCDAFHLHLISPLILILILILLILILILILLAPFFSYLS